MERIGNLYRGICAFENVLLAANVQLRFA